MNKRKTKLCIFLNKPSKKHNRQNTIYDTQRSQRGIILILSFMVLMALTSIVASFLYVTSTVTKSAGFGEADDQALWLAEAGFNKAGWNLMTPLGSGGQGEDWTTAGTTENLGAGSYIMIVARWDWALAGNGSSASASSEFGSQIASNVNDENDSTYWQSNNKPSNPNPETMTITFPYTLTLNKVRFLVPTGSSQQRPKDYQWQVSSDNSSYTTVKDVSGNDSTDRTDEFTAATNANYLRLEVTKIGGGSQGVRIATLEAIGEKITSTGTAGSINRKFERTVAVDETTVTAFGQIDWLELAP